MLIAIELAVVLLGVATVVAVLARRLRVPYTVFLVVAGLALGALARAGVGPLEGLVRVHLSKELILLIFLPPLLFEGTLNMDLEILRRHLLPVVLLATAGTLVTTALLGGSLVLCFGFGVTGALLLGAMLAPTDPVSVLALFKEAGVDKDLSTLVEGESVFNDGVAVVLFLIFYQMVEGRQITLARGAADFGWSVLLGGGIGLAGGYAVHRLLGLLDEHLTEVMLSLVLAYGVYVAAEALHASGVIAVVAAGLIIGNYGKLLSMSPTTRLSLGTFWEVAAFLVNSYLFLMMGLETRMGAVLSRAGTIAVIFVAMLAIRSLVTYGFFRLVALRRPYPLAWQHIVNWGGLRGSIPIALVLGLGSLKLQSRGGTLAADEILQIVAGVVLLSLLVQGLSIGWLLKKLGFVRASPIEREYELLRGRTISLKAAREALGLLHERGELAPHLHRGMQQQIDAQLAELAGSTEGLLGQHHELKEAEYRKVAHALLLAERSAVEDALRQGILSEESLRVLLSEIDDKLAAADGSSPLYAAEQIDEKPD